MTTKIPHEFQKGALNSAPLLDALSTAVFSLDRVGRITTVNSAAETLLGRTRRGLQGEPAAEFIEEAGSWFPLSEGAGMVSYASLTELRRGLADPVRVRAVLSSLSAEDVRA